MSLKKLGRYEITGTLGRGAMGVVYQAHDPLIERTVAIKTISYAGLSPKETEDFEQRFFREAKSAGRLNHPNIVTIHDVGHSDDLAYIAMEFLSGCSLRSVLDSGVVLTPRRIAEIAVRVADGLAFAHANGVVHRDIKPANIMVLDSDVVKIADFGIASLSSGSLTMVGTALGSPKYMSPEQVLGQKADGRSDIFSLGVVLYEMLTGRPPFVGDDLNAILYQVLNGEPPLPSSHNPGLPPGFDQVIARALKKKPEERYQNAADMAADLRNYRRRPSSKQRRKRADKDSSISRRSGDATPPGDETSLMQRRELPANSTRGKGVRGLRYAVPIAVLAILAGLGWYLLPPPTPSLPAESAAPAKTSNADEKKVNKIAQEAKRPQQNEAEKTATQVDEKVSERILATPKKPPSSPSWQSALRAELAVCARDSFFPRLLCSEKARWKYCPGHWGSIDECTKGPNPSP